MSGECEPMGDLQALVTGSILGGLMKAEEVGITIEVEAVTDALGYLPEIRVRGRRSGERLIVRIERDEEQQ